MLDKLKIFFDNNAYDELLKLNQNDFNILLQNCILYGCDTIDDELNAMETRHPDKLQQITKIRNNIKVKRASFFGFATTDNPHPKNIGGFATYDCPDKGGMWMTYEFSEYQHKIKTFLDTYGKKKSKLRDNENDAIIAVLAKMASCCLITYDGVTNEIPRAGNKDLGLYQAVKNNGGLVMTIKELLNYLKASSK